MADLIKHNGKIIIYGTKLKDGNPNIGAYVVLWSEDSATEIANTTTDKNGDWSFEFAEDGFTEGNYTIRFYGSGTIQKLESEGGDWEKLKINFSRSDADIEVIADGRIEVKVGTDTEIGYIREGKKATGSKLNLDNDIDDGTTYKRVTGTEKTNWDATKTTVDNNKPTWDTVTEKASQSSVNALSTRFTTAENDISTLESDVASLETNVGTLQTDMGSVENKTQKLKTTGDVDNSSDFYLADNIYVDSFGNLRVATGNRIILEHQTAIQLGFPSEGSIGKSTNGGYIQLIGSSSFITLYDAEIIFGDNVQKIAYSGAGYIYTDGNFNVTGKYMMDGITIIESDKSLKNITGITLSSGYFQGDYKSSDGSIGQTGIVNPGAVTNLSFKDGLYVGKNVIL